MNEDDIVFYYYVNDWKKTSKACLFKDFKSDKMAKIEADYNSINKVFHKQNIKNWKINRVDIRYKEENNNIYHNIKWTDFDPRTMSIANDKNDVSEFNIKEMVKQKRAPGLVSKTSRDRGSVMHRGRVDEGAMEDLLDKSLPKAKVRARNRQKSRGSAFTKNRTNQTLLRRK